MDLFLDYDFQTRRLTKSFGRPLGIRISVEVPWNLGSKALTSDEVANARLAVYALLGTLVKAASDANPKDPMAAAAAMLETIQSATQILSEVDEDRREREE